MAFMFALLSALLRGGASIIEKPAPAGVAPVQVYNLEKIVADCFKF
ncbi:MAG: hypothetical protein ACOX1G_02725 [bacterium]|jgi:hypothetical protein